MSYRIAGIDVHKKILAVVVSDVEVDFRACETCRRPVKSMLDRI